MWNSFFASLEALFLQFNVKRLFYWFTLLAGAAIFLVFAERVSGFLFYWQLERRIDLATKLLALEVGGVQSHYQLSVVYKDLISSLQGYKNPSIDFPSFSAPNVLLEDILKFLSGGFLGFLLAIWGYSNREDRSYAAIYGGLIFGMIFGLIGVAIPTASNPLVNYISYPIAEIFLVGLQLSFMQYVSDRQQNDKR
jgi:hypothetical protein